MSTLYASFVDAGNAERAAGALLDQGALPGDISIIANEAYNSIRAVNANQKAMDAEIGAKTGISTTTPGDVAVGAVKGATIGLGVGVAAVLASIFIPGLGLIFGGGAFATAVAGGAATILAGGAAGGVVGYLRDQGVPEEMITRYSDDFVSGGAILAIAVPSGALTSGEIEGILVKYGAMNVATYNSAKLLINDPTVEAPKVPLVVDNPNIDRLAVTAVDVVETPVTEAKITEVIDASTGQARVVATQVQPTAVDPVTGVPVAAVAVDPLTQVERPVVVDPTTGTVVAPAVAPITTPVTGVTIDPVTGLPINPVPAAPVVTPTVVETVEPAQVIVDPTPTTGVVVDPISGLEIPATPAEGLAGEAIAPVQTDIVVEDEDQEIMVKKRNDIDLY